MMRFVTAALLALASSPAFGAGDCWPIDHELRDFDRAGGSQPVFLEGAARDRAAVLYNRHPPQTDEAWDVVFMGDLPRGRAVLAVGRGREICGRIFLDPGEHRAVMRAILGEPV